MENNVQGEFTTDFDKELFRIEITACVGGIRLKVLDFGDHKSQFHEVVGALEYMKFHVMDTQREKNKSLAAKINTAP